MEFTLKTIIDAPANVIYSAWLESEGHTKMTGGEANISNEVGFCFSAWDEYITGENLILEENKRIVQSWRSADFLEQEDDSHLEILFNEINGSTEITLIHSKLSESGEQYKSGWEEHYFQPMKDFFE